MIANAIQGQWVVPNITRTAAADYVGSAGASGQVRVTRIERATGIGASSLLTTREIDDHNVPAIIQCASGKMLASYCRHALETKMRYRVSASADSDNWAPAATFSTSAVATYCQLHRAEGSARIWILYRVGNSSVGDWCVRFTDDEGVTWSPERLLAPNTYVLSVQVGNVIRCFAYDNPLLNSNHDIYYFQVDLATGDVTNAAGTLTANAVSGAGLPITRTQQQKIVDVSPPTSTRLYEASRSAAPAILISEFTSDAMQSTYCRYTYANATGLFNRSAVTASGPAFKLANAYFGGACFDETDSNVVYCARNLGPGEGVGSWELVRMETADNGATWTRAAVMHESANIIARPQVRAGLLWFSEISKYVTYTNFTSSLQSIDLTS